MIGFESDQAILQKLRQRLRRMTDEELVKFGKQVRKRPDASPDPVRVSITGPTEVAGRLQW